LPGSLPAPPFALGLSKKLKKGSRFNNFRPLFDFLDFVYGKYSIFNQEQLQKL